MELTDKDFKEKVLESDYLVFVDFWGSWCLACQQMPPIIKKLDKELEKVDVHHLNIDKNPKTAEELEIEETPTHILFKNGEIIEREHAAKTKEELKEMIEKHLDQ